MFYSKADVSSTAVFNPSAKYPEDKIKRSDISLIYPYDNTLYILEMNGAQLKKYMEWSASYYNTFKDGDLTISFNSDIPSFNYDIFDGVNYEINVANESGSRIQNLTKLDGTPIKDTDVFKVAVNNYRATSQLTSPDIIFEKDEFPKVLEVDVKGEIGGVREQIVEYITTEKKGEINPSSTKNWKIVGNNWDNELRAKLLQLIKEGKISVPASEDGRNKNFKAITTAELNSVLNNEQNNTSEQEQVSILNRAYKFLNTTKVFKVASVNDNYFITKDDFYSFIQDNSLKFNDQIENVIINNQVYFKVKDIANNFGLNIDFNNNSKITTFSK